MNIWKKTTETHRCRYWWLRRELSQPKRSEKSTTTWIQILRDAVYREGLHDTEGQPYNELSQKENPQTIRVYGGMSKIIFSTIGGMTHKYLDYDSFFGDANQLSYVEHTNGE